MKRLSMLILCCSVIMSACSEDITVGIIEKDDVFYLQLHENGIHREILIENMEKYGNYTFTIIKHEGGMDRGSIMFSLWITNETNVCGQNTFATLDYDLSKTTNFFGLYTYYDCARAADFTTVMVTETNFKEFVIITYERDKRNLNNGCLIVFLYDRLKGARLLEKIPISQELSYVSYERERNMFRVFAIKTVGGYTLYTLYI